MDRFAGARVLVTGASRGVGLSAALGFAAEGADVALLARPGVALEDARVRAAELGVRAIGVGVDIADTDRVGEAVPAAIAELGGLDVLVSNAAAVVFGPFDRVAEEDFERVVAVTFRGAVAAIEASLPALRSSRGAIVATASLNALLPLPTFSAYAAAKHALRGWLTARRPELAADGVSASLLHPGPIATPLWHQATSATGHLPRFPPEGQSPETVAAALLDLAVSREPEVVLGAEARALDALARTAPPLAEAALRAMYLWYASGRERAPQPGALWASPPGADRSSRLVARPSVGTGVGAL